MNEINLSDKNPGPGQLADYLAELLKRFRHFSDPMEPAPGMVSHLVRIKVSARLLTALDRSPGRASEGFVRLGGVLSEWVNYFEASPESFPLHLVSPVQRLADYLEKLLVRRDQGVPAVELDRDAGWRAVLVSFQHAGTPLAVLEDVEDLFDKWGRRWNDENLTPVQEQQLLRRWLSLKIRGDVLFQMDEGPKPWPAGHLVPVHDFPEILLLVDSTFRRDEIRDKLTNRNYRVETPCDPDQALELLAANPAPRVVLCDNMEPTRHLVRLREGLSSLMGVTEIPLVLVVGSTLAGTVDDERARSLGAVAAWREPFDPVDLGRILQCLS
ncbi:MAG: response regulator [Candidatus Krumholzibacteria bacterium]|nr:response regulator [Candidatus Krumholzibacteria bacterium]